MKIITYIKSILKLFKTQLNPTIRTNEEVEEEEMIDAIKLVSSEKLEPLEKLIKELKPL